MTLNIIRDRGPTDYSFTYNKNKQDTQPISCSLKDLRNINNKNYGFNKEKIENIKSIAQKIFSAINPNVKLGKWNRFCLSFWSLFSSKNLAERLGNVISKYLLDNPGEWSKLLNKSSDDNKAIESPIEYGKSSDDNKAKESPTDYGVPPTDIDPTTATFLEASVLLLSMDELVQNARRMKD